MGEAWDRLKKDWDLIKKKGFNTAEASADVAIQEKRKDPEFEDKSSELSEMSPMERALKFKKGFLKGR